MLNIGSGTTQSLLTVTIIIKPSAVGTKALNIKTILTTIFCVNSNKGFLFVLSQNLPLGIPGMIIE